MFITDVGEDSQISVRVQIGHDQTELGHVWRGGWEGRKKTGKQVGKWHGKQGPKIQKSGG